MADDDDQDASVLVFRNKVGDPIAVPSEVAEQASRPYRAYLDRLQAMTWAQIADKHEYLNAAAAQYDVEQYMAQGRALVQDSQRQHLLALNAARLEALLQAVWAQAMNGHLPAVNTAAQLVGQHSKLLRLDDESMDADVSGPKTVIVPVDDAQYRAELERQAEGV